MEKSTTGVSRVSMARRRVTRQFRPYEKQVATGEKRGNRC